MQDNQIHTEGAKSLARAFKSNQSLVSVNLRYAREMERSFDLWIIKHFFLC